MKSYLFPFGVTEQSNETASRSLHILFMGFLLWLNSFCFRVVPSLLFCRLIRGLQRRKERSKPRPNAIPPPCDAINAVVFRRKPSTKDSIDYPQAERYCLRFTFIWIGCNSNHSKFRRRSAATNVPRTGKSAAQTL